MARFAGVGVDADGGVVAGGVEDWEADEGEEVGGVGAGEGGGGCGGGVLSGGGCIVCVGAGYWGGMSKFHGLLFG